MGFVFTKARSHKAVYLPVAVIGKSADEKTKLLNKLRSFLNREEPKTVKWLLSFWGEQQEAITYKELREAYLNGYITGGQIQKWQEDYSRLITEKLLPQWEIAMEEAAAEIRQQSDFSYNSGMETAREYIKSHGAELVTQLTEEQRNALNAVIRQGAYYDAVTADELSRIMRPCIGLTAPQSKANLNYYNGVKAALLKSGLKESDALKKAAEKAAKYAGKQHRYRAMNIARTELASAYNRGGYFSAKGAQTMGYIGRIKKVWLTAADERVCPVCGMADGEECDIESVFSMGKKLPPAHPSCRCAVAYEEVEGTNILLPENNFNSWETSEIQELDDNRENGVDNFGESGIIEVESKAELERAIREGKIKLEINPEKQNRHIKGTKEYIEGRSYLNISLEEAQKIVYEKSGTGKIHINENNGVKQFRETVVCDKDIGVAINKNKKRETATNVAKIHYSRAGTHIVPIEE